MGRPADEHTPLTGRSPPDPDDSSGARPDGRRVSFTRLTVLLTVAFAACLLVVSGALNYPTARMYYLMMFGSLEDVSERALAIMNCNTNRVQPSVYLLGVQKAGTPMFDPSTPRGRLFLRV